MPSRVSGTVLGSKDPARRQLACPSQGAHIHPKKEPWKLNSKREYPGKEGNVPNYLWDRRHFLLECTLKYLNSFILRKKAFHFVPAVKCSFFFFFNWNDPRLTNQGYACISSEFCCSAHTTDHPFGCDLEYTASKERR